MSQLLFQQIETIIQIKDKEFDYNFSHFSKKKFKKHQFVIQEGENVPNDYFILNGCLKSYFTDINGKEHILQFGMQDWWFTDYQAYYNQTKATINIDCIENSELLCLSFENRENPVPKCTKWTTFLGRKQINIMLLCNNAYYLY